MQFRVVDIRPDSRQVTFIFSNDGTFQLQVTTKDYKLFEIAKLYDIEVKQDLMIENTYIGTCPKNIFSNLGVITRKTRNSIHVSCGGNTQWKFPRFICNLTPGTDVWIIVKLVEQE